ncbi:Peptidyl-tRNA hydrolase [bioreactor metagenome]|uniref:Peptidyl-tRNA hydrolase n=1 Tax=bioreactor metagenome TaxID=1076179 RepID=A0A645HY11_9ZZZZ
MKSIIYLLNRDDFPRIRIGIGKQPEYMDLADYVTGKFSKEEIPIMTEAVEKAADAAQEIVLKGIAAAMNKFNGIMFYHLYNRWKNINI